MIAKILVSFTLFACFQSVALADYTINEQDESVLLALGEIPEEGMEYVRCKHNLCYVIQTGEFIGEQADGIYLVWVDSPPLSSNSTE